MVILSNDRVEAGIIEDCGLLRETFFDIKSEALDLLVEASFGRSVIHADFYEDAKPTPIDLLGVFEPNVLVLVFAISLLNRHRED